MIYLICLDKKNHMHNKVETELEKIEKIVDQQITLNRLASPFVRSSWALYDDWDHSLYESLREH